MGAGDAAEELHHQHTVFERVLLVEAHEVVVEALGKGLGVEQQMERCKVGLAGFLGFVALSFGVVGLDLALLLLHRGAARLVDGGLVVHLLQIRLLCLVL